MTKPTFDEAETISQVKTQPVFGRVTRRCGFEVNRDFHASFLGASLHFRNFSISILLGTNGAAGSWMFAALAMHGRNGTGWLFYLLLFSSFWPAFGKVPSFGNASPSEDIAMVMSGRR